MTYAFSASRLGVALVLLDAGVVRGQKADSAAARSRSVPPQPVFSIGQPPIWRQQFSAQGTAVTQDGRFGGTFSYGVFHALNKPPIQAFNPLLGVIGGTLEGYGSAGG